MNDIKILFLGGGPIMPSSQPMETLKYKHLSRYFSGDILSIILDPKHKKIEYIGSFGYHPFIPISISIFKSISTIIYLLKKPISLFYSNCKYDVIISPNPLLNGIIALIIAKLFNAKVIIEVNGNFESAFRYGDINFKPTYSHFSNKIKEYISNIVIPFVLNRSHMVKLLSDNQLNAYSNKLNKLKTCVFSDFVPVHKFISHKRSDKKYILLIGHPWYLKGVDILIRAFNIASNYFPEYKLKVIGWCPKNKEYFINLSNNNPNIELCDSVYYHEIIPFMANCSIYVLASRTEAMGRVLIEAMACKKPIIASNVGGVYSIIKDRYNGLLFESENVQDLANKIIYLLSHPDYASRLAENGFLFAQNFLSEDAFVGNYKDMINKTLKFE